MQAVSRDIRTRRTQQTITEGMRPLSARAERVARLRTLILTDGQPETRDGSTEVCTHYYLRRGDVDGCYAEAQVYRHRAGIVIRFFVWESFAVRVRDLVLLPVGRIGAGDDWEKNDFDVWLESDGKIFPHAGKYAERGRKIVSNVHISSMDRGAA